MWMGGVAPIGYRIEHRKLVVNGPEVKLANHIFERYLVLKSVLDLKRELELGNIKTPVRKSLKGKVYGGLNFSRGALYAILKNPAFIGKISHKGKIHEGLHQGIIPIDLWERVQIQLKEQTVARTRQTQHRHMLQGLLFDTEGTLYSPTFTKRHGRQYRYYISQNLIQNKDHPYGIMSRLPAQEIEGLVESTLRKEVGKLSGVSGGRSLSYILDHHQTIPGIDLVSTCIEKATVGLNTVRLSINPTGLKGLVAKHMNLAIEENTENIQIDLPFTIARASAGAIVIEPDGPRDLLDLAPDKLKKLVQGILWREEHFEGKTLTEIARREGCSDAHVGKSIMYSFNLLQSAPPRF